MDGHLDRCRVVRSRGEREHDCEDRSDGSHASTPHRRPSLVAAARSVSFVVVRAAVVVLATVLLTACDGGESSFPLPTWDAGVPGTQYEAACSSWANSRCAWEKTCYPGEYVQWTSAAQCVDRHTIDCELHGADPAVAFDPAAVAGCVFPTDCSQPDPLLCLSLGSRSPGEPCEYDEDCASGSCDLPANSGCGSCGTTYQCTPACSDGQVCIIEEDGGTSCLVPPAVGQPCSPPSYVCAAQSVCQIGSGAGSGVCVPLVGVGQLCSDLLGGAQCYDPSFETFCDSTQHCQAAMPASYGQPCGQLGDSLYECVGWGSCEYATTPVCIPPANDGSLCDDQQGLSCLYPARCVDHVCLFPSAEACGVR